uniref:Myotubularin phosphatase domain-containing protein n=1 Tax=Gongylonema pulchrum TaxID=637853 RepID=A0A183D6W7_9BILA
LLDASSNNRLYTGPFSLDSFDQSSQSTDRISTSLAAIVMSGHASKCGNRTLCMYYLSPLEFFFYCCCGTDFEDCAYTDDPEILSYASINAEVWRSRSEIRSFYKPEGKEFVNRSDIFGRPWLYEKFIYSLPVGGH